MKTVLEILKGALRRIEDPKHWVRGHYGLDGNGLSVLPNGNGAVCWCAGGAILAEVDEFAFCELPPVHPARSAVKALVGAGVATLQCVNDEGTHKSIVALFRNAIAKLEAEATP